MSFDLPQVLREHLVNRVPQLGLHVHADLRLGQLHVVLLGEVVPTDGGSVYGQLYLQTVRHVTGISVRAEYKRVESSV